MHGVLALGAALFLQAAPAKQEEKPLDAAQGKPRAPEAPLLKGLAESITIGGQSRLRAEYRDPVAYSDIPASREDDDLLLLRLRLNFGFALADAVDVFIQPQDQRIFGEEASALSDENNLDLHQGFVEVRKLLTDPLSIKMGRQELSYGDQRLVSPLDWSNIARSWDGIKIRYAPGEGWAEAFYTVIKEGTGAEDDQDFYGLYASYAGLNGYEFDAYVFGRELNDNLHANETIPAPVHDRRDWTAGARIKVKEGGLDATAEGMLQRGEIDDDDIQAWAAAFTLGFTFDVSWKPRVGLEYTHASGDGDPADGDIETFDPLFPFGHFYQGFADVFAFRNSRDLAVYLRAAPTDTLTVSLDVHSFWLDEERDAWYNFAGVPIRRDVTGAADERVGHELDLHARLSVGKHVKFWGGWSHFFAGPFVEDTPGTDRDMNWFFLQMTVDF